MQNCFLFFFFFFLFSLFFFLHVKLFLLFCIISFFLFFFQNVFFPFIIFLLRRIFLFIQIYLIFYISLFYMYSAQRPEGLVTPNSKSFLACISFVPCQVISCSTLLLHLHDNFWPSFLSASRFWLHHYNMKNRKTYLHDMIYDVPLPRTRIRLYNSVKSIPLRQRIPNFHWGKVWFRFQKWRTIVRRVGWICLRTSENSHASARWKSRWLLTVWQKAKGKSWLLRK